MLSQRTIPKKKTNETALDYQQLYAIGLKHVQNLSSRIWTDYNVHDPGITILELLCYALTDLSYRASFPVEDILASESANSENMKKQFFTARQILPNRSLTLSDYRKLLIDLKGVKNAWLQPATLSYYADTFDGKLLGSATLLVGEIVELPSFAAKMKQPSEGVSQYLSERLSKATRQSLSAYQGTESNPEPLQTALIQDLNQVIQGVSIYEAQRFAAVNLSAETDTLRAQNVQGEALIHLKQLLLNRLLLEDAYPQEISKNQPLRQKPNLLGIVEVKIGGLYDVIIEYEEKADEQKVMQDVKQKLQSNRNLCEDFVNFIEVDTQSFLLCAELELTPDADVAKVKAEILFQVQQYLAPPVNNYSLNEMLVRTKADGTPYTADEIFDGPILDCGFIDDDELAKADLRKEIRLSDIISIIMDIEGVQAVRDIVINPQDNQIPLKNKWVVPIAPNKKAILSHDLKDNINEQSSRLVFYKRNMPVVANNTKAKEYYLQFNKEAKAKAETTDVYDFDIPLGNYRKLDSYYSFQNHFPVVYGLSEVGLSSAADDKRQALAYQLKAYLLFFDQIMANYFAQLSHVKELFSIEPNLHRTYFYQVVDSFAEFNKIYSPTDVVATIENEVEDTSVLIERRNRFLDHLIARFAERFNDFVYIMYSAFGASPESIVKDKCDFLNNYPQISSERSLAYNYSLKGESDLWNTENVSGLEKRLARLLGIRNYKRRNLGEIVYDIYTEVDETPGAGDGFSFRIRKRDTPDIILSSTTNYATHELAWEALKGVIHFALLPSGYERKLTENGQHYFNVINNTGNVLARCSGDFNTEAQMNNAIDEAMEYLRVNYSDEGMYLIENLLLRPEKKDDPFLPICPDPNCIDCAELDPYSYRIHIILPAYGSRFSNMEFRRFTEEVIREETPAHILPKICWINKKDMAEFEKLYREGIYLKAGVETTQRQEKLSAFIEKLFTVKNIYPAQNLHECDSPEEQPKFILGRSAIGTQNKDKT
jgi:hypothetical protein